MYPAIEMMPIYNTFNILLNMLCGSVILGEAKMYEYSEMLVLCLFSAICISGIFVLVKKPHLSCLEKASTQKTSNVGRLDQIRESELNDLQLG